MKSNIDWKQDGWFVIQEADSKLHIKGIVAFAENGTVTKVTMRHGDDEEKKCTVTVGGVAALPISVATFKELYEKGMLSFQ